MWREIEDPGTPIDGEYLPPGTDVGTSMYAIHHNEDYYPDPYVFKPERWLHVVNTEDEVERVYGAFNPFSLGPRGCVGRGLAYMELSDTLAKLLWHLDLRKPEGPLGKVGEGRSWFRNGRHHVKEFQLVDHLTSIKDGPFVEFRRRELV